MDLEPDVRLTLRPLPGDVPSTNRLRRLLKVLLRGGYGFRCLKVEELPRESEPESGPAHRDKTGADTIQSPRSE